MPPEWTIAVLVPLEMALPRGYKGAAVMVTGEPGRLAIGGVLDPLVLGEIALLRGAEVALVAPVGFLPGVGISVLALLGVLAVRSTIEICT